MTERCQPPSRVGIQGGRGSFNDSAIRSYIARQRVRLHVSYLDTTPRVLEALATGDVDLGQFAIYNSAGGLYEESLYAMARSALSIVDQYSLTIAHALMIRRDVTFGSVEKIITHSEVVKHCKNTLQQRYSSLLVEIGKAELTDPAAVAKALAEGQLPGSVAILSNRLLAELHGLEIVDTNVEDTPDSKSTFLLVAAG